MIGRLNHVAIAVKDLDGATRLYKETLGAEVSAPAPQPAHGVMTVFVNLPNTKIELLGVLGDNSPIAKFLEKQSGRRHPPRLLRGRRHRRGARSLKKDGARVLGDGEPKIGAHGKPVLFLHPKDFCGTLVELEQA